MLTIYVICILLVCFLSLRYIHSFSLIENKWLMPIGFGIKLIAGYFFYYIYSMHYGSGQLTADAGRFLEESKILSDVFWKSPTDYFKFLVGLDDYTMHEKYLSLTSHWNGGPNTILNDSKNLLKIHSLFNFIAFGSPVIHIILSCFISLFGVFHLTKAFKKYVAIKSQWLFIILLLAPSTLFWTSGLLKEPYLFLGIGLFCRGILVKEDLRWKKILYISIGALLLIGFKPYTFICILAAMLIYLLFTKVVNRLYAFIILGSVVFILGACIFLIPSNKVVRILSAKQSDFIGISKGGTFIRNDTCFFIFTDTQMKFVKIEDTAYYLTKEIEVEYLYPNTKSEPRKTIAIPNTSPWAFGYKYNECGSYIPVSYIDNSSTQLFKNIPESLINATLRPFISDPGSNFKYLATIEIWLIFGVLLIIIGVRRKINREEFAMIMALIAFSFLMLLLVGWITPVLGAIVRYRFAALLAIMIIGLILLPKKLTSTR